MTDFYATLEGAVMERKGRKRGAEITFACPCHDDEHPSASYNIDKHAWTCRVCSAKGGARNLAQLIGVDMPRVSTRRNGGTPPKHEPVAIYRYTNIHGVEYEKGRFDLPDGNKFFPVAQGRR
jgi:hypothetical protein